MVSTSLPLSARPLPINITCHPEITPGNLLMRFPLVLYGKCFFYELGVLLYTLFRTLFLLLHVMLTVAYLCSLSFSFISFS